LIEDKEIYIKQKIVNKKSCRIQRCFLFEGFFSTIDLLQKQQIASNSDKKRAE
jgi:hypothetical protein